jgi:hypothetical protein
VFTATRAHLRQTLAHFLPAVIGVVSDIRPQTSAATRSGRMTGACARSPGQGPRRAAARNGSSLLIIGVAATAIAEAARSHPGGDPNLGAARGWGEACSPAKRLPPTYCVADSLEQAR